MIGRGSKTSMVSETWPPSQFEATVDETGPLVPLPPPVVTETESADFGTIRAYFDLYEHFDFKEDGVLKVIIGKLYDHMLKLYGGDGERQPEYEKVLRTIKAFCNSPKEHELIKKAAMNLMRIATGKTNADTESEKRIVDRYYFLPGMLGPFRAMFDHVVEMDDGNCLSHYTSILSVIYNICNYYFRDPHRGSSNDYSRMLVIDRRRTMTTVETVVRELGTIENRKRKGVREEEVIVDNATTNDGTYYLIGDESAASPESISAQVEDEKDFGTIRAYFDNKEDGVLKVIIGKMYDHVLKLYGGDGERQPEYEKVLRTIKAYLNCMEDAKYNPRCVLLFDIAEMTLMRIAIGKTNTETEGHHLQSQNRIDIDDYADDEMLQPLVVLFNHVLEMGEGNCSSHYKSLFSFIGNKYYYDEVYYDDVYYDDDDDVEWRRLVVEWRRMTVETVVRKLGAIENRKGKGVREEEVIVDNATTNDGTYYLFGDESAASPESISGQVEDEKDFGTIRAYFDLDEHFDNDGDGVIIVIIGKMYDHVLKLYGGEGERQPEYEKVLRTIKAYLNCMEDAKYNPRCVLLFDIAEMTLMRIAIGKTNTETEGHHHLQSQNRIDIVYHACKKMLQPLVVLFNHVLEMDEGNCSSHYKSLFSFIENKYKYVYVDYDDVVDWRRIVVDWRRMTVETVVTKLGAIENRKGKGVREEEVIVDNATTNDETYYLIGDESAASPESISAQVEDEKDFGTIRAYFDNKEDGVLKVIIGKMYDHVLKLYGGDGERQPEYEKVLRTIKAYLNCMEDDEEDRRCVLLRDIAEMTLMRIAIGKTNTETEGHHLQSQNRIDIDDYADDDMLQALVVLFNHVLEMDEGNCSSHYESLFSFIENRYNYDDVYYDDDDDVEWRRIFVEWRRMRVETVVRKLGAIENRKGKGVREEEVIVDNATTNDGTYYLIGDGQVEDEKGFGTIRAYFDLDEHFDNKGAGVIIVIIGKMYDHMLKLYGGDGERQPEYEKVLRTIKAYLNCMDEVWNPSRLLRDIAEMRLMRIAIGKTNTETEGHHHLQSQNSSKIVHRFPEMLQPLVVLFNHVIEMDEGNCSSHYESLFSFIENIFHHNVKWQIDDVDWRRMTVETVVRKLGAIENRKGKGVREEEVIVDNTTTNDETYCLIGDGDADVRLPPQPQHSWLKPSEILLKLQNSKISEMSKKIQQKPPSGSLILYDTKALRFYKKDGYNWKKQKNGKTVTEGHMILKVEGNNKLHCYYAHSIDDDKFQRRTYSLLNKKSSIRLVHYLDVNSEDNDKSENVGREAEDNDALCDRHDSPTREKSVGTSSRTKKRPRRDSDGDDMNKKIGNQVHFPQNANRVISTNTSSLDDEMVLLTKEVESFPGFDRDSRWFYLAMQSLKDKYNKAIFKAMGDPNSKVKWLKTILNL